MNIWMGRMVVLAGLLLSAPHAHAVPVCHEDSMRDITPTIRDYLTKHPHDHVNMDVNDTISIIFPAHIAGSSGGISSRIPLTEKPVVAACLQYQMFLPEDFTFMRGGKLPGLYGGPADMQHSNASGCRDRDDDDGWSMRLMWREGGTGEAYGYLADPLQRCGTSIDRGAWIFPRNQWITLTLLVQMNNQSEHDGIMMIWLDDRLVINRLDLNYAAKGHNDGVQGLFLSSFFGGNGAQWAPVTAQSLMLRRFHFGPIQTAPGISGNLPINTQ